MRWLALSVLLATSVSAGERIPATFEVHPGPQKEVSWAPDGFVLVVRYPGAGGKEMARGFPFQRDRMNDEYVYQEEIRDCRQTWLGEARLWIEGLFEREEYDWDSLDLLVPADPFPANGLQGWGVSDDEKGLAVFWADLDSQLKVLPPVEEAEDSFRIQYMQAYVGQAPGYCYRNGESAGTKNYNQMGLVTDRDGWWIRGSVKTYRVYLDEKREPILRAVKLTDPPLNYQRICTAPNDSEGAR